MSKIIHFPGLNGLRFLAASGVIISHTESFKDFAGIKNLHDMPLFQTMGARSVELFFVLSGFLITYLLLSEFDVKKSIDLKKFWLRRILRIWPLYFLIVFIGFVVVPYLIHFPPLSDRVLGDTNYKLFLYVFMLPNVVFSQYPHMLGLSVLWSIGVEEQFYLTWPVVLKKFRKNIFKVLIFVIVVLLTVRLAFNLKFGFVPHNKVFGSVMGVNVKHLSILLNTLKFECMALGGLMAVIYFENKHRYLDIMYSFSTQVMTYLCLGVLFYLGQYFYFLNSFVYGLLFSLVIVNVASNKNSILKLDNRFYNVMGRISFGMYMYHSIALALMINFMTYIFPKFGIPQHIMLTLLVFLLTIAVSYVSYRYFEMPFLKLKKKFEVVSSRN